MSLEGDNMLLVHIPLYIGDYIRTRGTSFGRLAANRFGDQGCQPNAGWRSQSRGPRVAAGWVAEQMENVATGKVVLPAHPWVGNAWTTTELRSSWTMAAFGPIYSGSATKSIPMPVLRRLWRKSRACTNALLPVCGGFGAAKDAVRYPVQP